MSKPTPNNVVRLHEHLGSAPEGSQSKRLALLNKCKDIAVRHLERALPFVMDKTDDALFDLANHSDSNQEQSLYFETMREVRFKRAAMAQAFSGAFTASADAAISRLYDKLVATEQAEPGRVKLDLVEEGDFEESLAITNMVQKIRTRCHEQIYALEKRVAKLGKREEIGPHDNPYGPEAICNAFKTACAEIDASIDIRLIILKLFDRHVVDDLESLYHELNDRLARCGVLPEIRHVIKKDPAAGRALRRTRREAQYDTEPGYRPVRGHDDAPAATSLDAAAIGGSTAPSLDAGAGVADPFDDDELDLASGELPGAVSSGSRLLDALNRVMDVNGASTDRAVSGDDALQAISSLTALHQSPSSTHSELGSFDTTGVHTGTVNVLRDLKTTGVTAGMREVDVMMFDVVAMMFDFILDDRSMPAGMKALIGRLQIPVLKVALIDKSFFARKFHPARRLLNVLAETASGWAWEEDDNDVFYRKAESLVMRILDEFDERIELFEDVLEELESFLDDEERSIEQTATASAGTVEGRERLSLAKQSAGEEVERRLARVNVHRLVRDFVSSYWKELLFVRFFEEGEQGGGWTEALQTMDDLLWSVVPKTLPEDRKHLTALLPGLLCRLRDGMKQLAMPDEASSRYLGIFKQLHIAAIRNEPCDSSEVPTGEEDGGPHDPAPQEGQAWELSERPESADALSVEEISLVQMAIERANQYVHAAAQARAECAGMGTTMVAAQFHDERATVAHVGDARMYRLRGGAFEQITSDHSLRQQLVDRGFYTPAEAKANVQSNVVTRAIGADPGIEIDVQELEVEPGDLYLLCSDGLTDMVSDEDVAAVLRENGANLGAAVRQLVDAANDNGGCDNVSVVLARVTEPTTRARAGASTRVEIEGVTDVGRKRSHNEDHIATDADHGIAIVADGMGGCNAGEVASEMAVAIVLDSLRNGRVDVGLASPEALPMRPTSNARRLVETTTAAAALLGLATAAGSAPDDDDEHLELARCLEVGSWVEFHHGEGPSTRARLSWVSPVTGRYLFTDRKGMKVADASAHGLAAELRRGYVTLIEQVPLFDRIMVNITDHLRTETRPS